ncbi:MAG: 30S ribosomal protein S17e [Thaumarchaeota archaeon]|nr:30S ribosomal protein S17e [Nitrososphaerota archaeon]MCL5317459.1 30S ribosomal protein S17e [Nitrososphaerota archaeon]
MDRIKRIANQVLEAHRASFSDDFEKNKEVLEKVANVKSKALRNQIAGIITREMKLSSPKTEPAILEVAAE